MFAQSILAKLSHMKQSTINVRGRQLKMLGFSSIDENTLKGKIENAIETIESRNLANKKVYYHALLTVYKVSNHDNKELEYLEEKTLEAGKTTDKEREIKKENKYNESFNITWEQLKNTYYKLEKQCEEYPQNYNLARQWLLCALYSDNEFGPKRPVDIVNLKWDSIKENKINFTAIKNGFEYTSKPLSEYIFKPLIHIKKFNKGKHVFTSDKGLKYEVDSLNKTVLKKMLNTTFQELRQLYASYMYSLKPSPKELMRHAYELNHSLIVHIEDYVREYNEDYHEIQVLGKYRFKKITKYIMV